MPRDATDIVYIGPMVFNIRLIVDRFCDKNVIADVRAYVRKVDGARVRDVDSGVI